MNRRKAGVLCAATLLAAGAVPAIAQTGNLNFLRDAPVTHFDKADIALFRRTTTAALDEARDGETRTWSNSDTGSSGDVMVLRTLPAAEPKCRELKITNRAAGRSHTERALFCRDPDKDRWTMRPGAN